ncbi:hypothetical protein SISSUDRAFT_431090 [Sistotremastrum suecicum HHB10207 ss-3]|uniref:Uncharacterized protein n=1 Tax=Sistotremastrum suecicum HHB10207 ss-3 TaxID=1314776 RepID=A0A165YHZ2_9AGAM|nr:hypothetical protein SISSUDRAFT_431090 [Sistotremastrum suecicum HHB10207 ss-3]
MLIKLVPPPTLGATSILFTLTAPNLPSDLALPQAYEIILNNVNQYSLEPPRAFHALDKASWPLALLEEVVLDMTTLSVSVVWIDNTIEEWPLCHGLEMMLDTVLYHVQKSSAEAENEKAMEEERQRLEKEREKARDTPPSSPMLGKSRSTKQKRQRGLIMNLVASVLSSSTSSSEPLPMPSPPPTPSEPSSPLFGTSDKAPINPETRLSHVFRLKARSILLDAFRRYIVHELASRSISTGFVACDSDCTKGYPGYAMWITQSMLTRCQARIEQLLDEAEEVRRRGILKEMKEASEAAHAASTKNDREKKDLTDGRDEHGNEVVPSDASAHIGWSSDGTLEGDAADGASLDSRSSSSTAFSQDPTAPSSLCSTIADLSAPFVLRGSNFRTPLPRDAEVYNSYVALSGRLGYLLSTLQHNVLLQQEHAVATQESIEHQAFRKAWSAGSLRPALGYEAGYSMPMISSALSRSCYTASEHDEFELDDEDDLIDRPGLKRSSTLPKAAEGSTLSAKFSMLRRGRSFSALDLEVSRSNEITIDASSSVPDLSLSFSSSMSLADDDDPNFDYPAVQDSDDIVNESMPERSSASHEAYYASVWGDEEDFDGGDFDIMASHSNYEIANPHDSPGPRPSTPIPLSMPMSPVPPSMSMTAMSNTLSMAINLNASNANSTSGLSSIPRKMRSPLPVAFMAAGLGLKGSLMKSTLGLKDEDWHPVGQEPLLA